MFSWWWLGVGIVAGILLGWIAGIMFSIYIGGQPERIESDSEKIETVTEVTIYGVQYPVSAISKIAVDFEWDREVTVFVAISDTERRFIDIPIDSVEGVDKLRDDVVAVLNRRSGSDEKQEYLPN